MNPEYKERWIAALRSGEFQQGSLYLLAEDRGNKTYCCLGVAAHLFGDEYGIQRKETCGITWFDTVFSCLPDKLSNALGLNGEVQATLSRMNDSGKFSFNQIADWIEANVPTDSDTETETVRENLSGS